MADVQPALRIPTWTAALPMPGAYFPARLLELGGTAEAEAALLRGNWSDVGGRGRGDHSGPAGAPDRERQSPEAARLGARSWEPLRCRHARPCGIRGGERGDDGGEPRRHRALRSRPHAVLPLRLSPPRREAGHPTRRTPANGRRRTRAHDRDAHARACRSSWSPCCAVRRRRRASISTMLPRPTPAGTPSTFMEASTSTAPRRRSLSLCRGGSSSVRWRTS